MATVTKSDKPKTPPVHKIRCGSTVASIWENEGENGPWHNTTVQRTYREKERDELVVTSSYLDSQLLELAKAADLAHSWIVERQAQLRAERRSDRTNEERF